MSITKIEQARALREVSGALTCKSRTETLPDGRTVVFDEVKKLCGRPIGGDEIMLFVDTDGRVMSVVYDEDGPAKVELP